MMFCRGEHAASTITLSAARHQSFAGRRRGNAGNSGGVCSYAQNVKQSLPTSARHSMHGNKYSRHSVKTQAKRIAIELPAEPGDKPASQVFEIEESSEIFTLLLRKPLGITLEEKEGSIRVIEVLPNGNASRRGVQVGDILRGVSARTQDGTDSVFGTLVLMKTDGERFDTVMAAIQSSRCAQCDVVLVMERRTQA